MLGSGRVNDQPAENLWPKHVWVISKLGAFGNGVFFFSKKGSRLSG